METLLKTIKYKGKEVFSPTYDDIFKGIFLKRGGKGRLAALLSLILKTTITAKGIEVNNAEIAKDNVHNKGLFLDLKVTLADGSIVNVEMQAHNKYDMGKRSIYHAARLVTEQIEPGEEHIDLCPVIVIGILDFVYIENNKNFHNRFRMKNVENNDEMPDAEVFEVHFLELPKLPKGVSDDPLTQWLKFIAIKTEEDIDMILEKNPKTFKPAVERLVNICSNDVTRERLRKSEKYELERLWDLRSELTRGREEGIGKLAKELMAMGAIDSAVIAKAVENLKQRSGEYA